MGQKISWPKNPTLNQIYESPNGKFWIFKDCIWMHTCCPPCNFEDGLTYSVFIQAGESQFQAYYYLEYQGKDYNGNDSFFSVFDCDSSFGVGVYFDSETNLWTAFLGQSDGNPDFEIIATSSSLENSKWDGNFSYFFNQIVSSGYSQCSAPTGYGFCGTIDLGYGVILNPFYVSVNVAGDKSYGGVNLPDDYDSFITWNSGFVSISVNDLINGVSYTTSIPSSTGIPPTGDITLSPNVGGFGNVTLTLTASNTICCPP